MSRSRKKTPGGKDRNPFMKTYANRRFRRYSGELQNGKWYRRYTNPWDICDYKWLYFNESEISKHYPDEEYKMWMK